MPFPAFLFELLDKMPTVAYMYGSGVILASLVFAATYFHRQFGLMTLLLVGLICVRSLESPEVSESVTIETAESYVTHWNFSCRATFILSVILFFTAIILKRKIKQKSKLN